MSADNFNMILEELLGRAPFNAFTIELHGGCQYEIDHVDAILVKDGVAAVLAPGSVRVYIDHESVNQIFDAPRSLCPE